MLANSQSRQELSLLAFQSNTLQVITQQQAQELAEELGVPYLETSAKSSINVDEAFFTLAR